MLHSPRHIIAFSFVVFEEITVNSFCFLLDLLIGYTLFLLNGTTFWLFKRSCFYSFFILLQVLRYTHAAPFHGHLFSEAGLGQSTNQLYPTIFSFLLASVLRKSIALHSLWFLNSVQHSMPEMFQKVVHILQISFSLVTSLVQGYSRAPAVSLGMWHLHTWALLSSGNFGLLDIVIGYSSSVQDMYVI